MRGYKVFDPSWKCRSKQYQCPGVFEESVKLKVCGAGMHFCKRAIACFNYYAFNPMNKVAEVIATGDIVENEDKCCTNRLEIVREIPWLEVLTLVNIGINCTGIGNTGDHNTGNHNTGDYNTGYRNTGEHNTGNRNAGDFNLSNNETGCFCTKPHKIRMFNKETEMTFEQWRDSEAYRILLTMDSEHTIWWNSLTDNERISIKKIPNFNAKIFLKITGIDVRQNADIHDNPELMDGEQK